MKTKEITKGRKAGREFDVALLECKVDYGEILTDDILEEVFMEDEFDD